MSIATLRVALVALLVHIPCLKSYATQTPELCLLINGRIGLQLGWSAPEFFREYKRTTGMTSIAFPTPMCYAAALKVHWNDWNVALDAQYSSVSVGDNGPVSVLNAQQSDVGERHLTETINVSSVPLTLSVEYSPYRTQFRNYVGIGGGVSVVHTAWTESCISEIANDPRRGGVFLNSTKTKALIRVYTGVELGFDTNSKESAGSLIIEAGYSYCENMQRPFVALAEQETIIPAVNTTSMSMGVSAVNLVIGLQFSFARKAQ